MTTTVAILGSTGKLGGWVLEGLLEKKYNVRALCRSPEKLNHYLKKEEWEEEGDTDKNTTTINTENLTVVKGDSVNIESLKEVLQGCQVLISCLGSPSKENPIVEASALSLIKVLKEEEEAFRDVRVIWCSTEGVNDGVKQARKMGCSNGCLPSCNIFGWGFMGFMQYACIVPYAIGQNVWDDMALSEDAFRNKSNANVSSHTVIVRPQIMVPFSEKAAFTEKWREEGGDVISYIVGHPSEKSPIGCFINKKSIAKFFVDAVESKEWDGTTVHLFQGGNK